MKVLDFGLAKAMTGDASGLTSGDAMNSPTLTARATQMGVILGTAAYMAPEQAKGRPVDRRADIWAFGVVLFEMLTGRRGYEAEDVSDTLAAVLTREVDWTALPASTPPALRMLVRDCLVRDPRQRLRDIGEARRIIERVTEGGAEVSAGLPGAMAPAVRVSRGTAWLPWSVAAAALVVAALAGWSAWQTEPTPPNQVIRTETLLKDFSALLSIAPDGTKLAYAIAGGANTSYLAIRHLNEFTAKPLSGTDGAGWPVFSPDGQWVAFSLLNGAQIRKVPVTGGTPTTLCEGTFFSGADWGPDDTIVFASAKGLMRVSAAGGTPTALTTVDTAKGEAAHSRPQFLPGGQQILFTVNGRTPADAKFAVVDLAGGTPRILAAGGVRGTYLASGHLAYMRGTTVFAVPFDPASLTIVGAEAPVIENVSQTGPVGTADFAVSERGLLAYFTSGADGQGTTLAWSDRKGVTTPLPGRPTQLWGTGRLSPNGRFVANGIIDNSGSRDIWIYDVERGTSTRVTFGAINDFPIWTQNSAEILFSGPVDGKPAIQRAPADGSGKPRLVMATPANATPESLSADGRTLVYSQAQPEKPTRLMVVTIGADGAAAGEPRQLHDANATELHGQISPDGKWIAYTSTESGASEIYVHAFPQAGGRTRISTEGGQRPRWSRDGRELWYWTGQPSVRLMSVSLEGGDPTRPGPPTLIMEALAGTTWDVTADRNRFLIELTASREGVRLATVTNWFDELRVRVPRKQ